MTPISSFALFLHFPELAVAATRRCSLGEEVRGSVSTHQHSARGVGDAVSNAWHDQMLGLRRLIYQSGVIAGFRDKLRGERTELRGTGLVWLGDKKLEQFYRARHPRIVHRHRFVRAGATHDAGHKADRKVVLHKPVTTGGSGTRGLLGS